MKYPDSKIVALCGGVGGSKLALGLNEILDQKNLSIITNTGDDFLYLGFYICPDIDTVIYTLAGINNPENGWGRKNETWKTLDVLKELGADTWFKLGDKDLAVHLFRSKEKRNGILLTTITRKISNKFGLRTNILPMSNHMVHTTLDTNIGEISFQDYFVRRKCEPVVKNIIFKSKKPVATDAVNRALKAQDLNGLVICPSNPYLSIDPILSIPRIKKLIQNLKKPRIAISPIVDGDSIKGPTSKIMQEMGIEVSSSSIAKHYQGLIDGIIIDQSDEAQVNNIEKMGIQVKLANIIVKTKTEKNKLAQESLEFLDEISKS
jgi:LPPG:FO 2-phospho-L-lactate transferase